MYIYAYAYIIYMHVYNLFFSRCSNFKLGLLYLSYRSDKKKMQSTTILMSLFRTKKKCFLRALHTLHTLSIYPRWLHRISPD